MLSSAFSGLGHSAVEAVDDTVAHEAGEEGVARVQQQAQAARTLGEARETFRRDHIAGMQRHPGEDREG